MIAPLGLAFVIHVSIILSINAAKVGILSVKRIEKQIKITTERLQGSFVHVAS